MEATSLTHANQIRNAYELECIAAGVQPRRLRVDRTDVQQDWVDDGNGGWEFRGGRLHQATVKFSRTFSAPSSPLVLYADTIEHASPGFTIVGGGEGSPEGRNIRVPESGYWGLSATNVNIAGGAAADLGRVFFQFSTTSGSLTGRLGTAIDENNISGSIDVYLSAGAQVRVQCYHASGGQRTWSADISLLWRGPRW